MQDEVQEFLKKHEGKWFTSTEIAKKMNISQGAAIRSLNGLWMRGWIDKDVITTKLFKFRYCNYDTHWFKYHSYKR